MQKHLIENVYKTLGLSHAAKGHGPDKASDTVAKEASEDYKRKQSDGASGKFTSVKFFVEAYDIAKKTYTNENTDQLIDPSTTEYEFSPSNSWPRDWAEVYMVNEKVDLNFPVLDVKPFENIEVQKIQPNKIRVVFNRDGSIKTIYPIYAK